MEDLTSAMTHKLGRWLRGAARRASSRPDVRTRVRLFVQLTHRYGRFRCGLVLAVESRARAEAAVLANLQYRRHSTHDVLWDPQRHTTIESPSHVDKPNIWIWACLDRSCDRSCYWSQCCAHHCVRMRGLVPFDALCALKSAQVQYP
jgi:hypothetical protein